MTSPNTCSRCNPTANQAFLRGLFVFLFLLTSPAFPATAAEPVQPERMLWAGSSSLYYHNQPKVLADWLTQHAGKPATADLVGRSGTAVHVFLRDDFKPEYGLKPGETILQKIAGGNYQYLVLQIPAEFINGPEGEEHDRSLDIYCNAIREAGGEPVFYEMGWGRDEAAEVGREKTLAAAIRNKVNLFVPCSSAWKRVRAERPDLELQNPPDTAHPGTLGAYLNLCCFYTAFTGKKPAGLPRTIKIWRHLTDAEKTHYGEIARETEFDIYDAALPGWMRRMVVAAEAQEIPEATARYLQETAWAVYQDFQQKLQE